MSDTRRRVDPNAPGKSYMTKKYLSNISGARKRGWTSTTKRFCFVNGHGIVRNSKYNLQKKIEHLKLEEDLNC